MFFGIFASERAGALQTEGGFEATNGPDARADGPGFGAFPGRPRRSVRQLSPGRRELPKAERCRRLPACPQAAWTLEVAWRRSDDLGTGIFGQAAGVTASADLTGRQQAGFGRLSNQAENRDHAFQRGGALRQARISRTPSPGEGLNKGVDSEFGFSNVTPVPLRNATPRIWGFRSIFVTHDVADRPDGGDNPGTNMNRGGPSCRRVATT